VSSQEPLEAFVQIYAENLLEMAGAEPFSVEKIVEFKLQHFPEQAEPLPKSAWDSMKGNLVNIGVGEEELKILSDM
jgi:hypothetical protein